MRLDRIDQLDLRPKMDILFPWDFPHPPDTDRMCQDYDVQAVSAEITERMVVKARQELLAISIALAKQKTRVVL